MSPHAPAQANVPKSILRKELQKTGRGSRKDSNSLAIQIDLRYDQEGNGKLQRGCSKYFNDVLISFEIEFNTRRR